jgi:hypothetical protein
MSARDCLRRPDPRCTCDVCGTHCGTVHIPLRARGWYCADHCPACRGPAIGPRASNEHGAARPLDVEQDAGDQQSDDGQMALAFEQGTEGR